MRKETQKNRDDEIRIWNIFERVLNENGNSITNVRWKNPEDIYCYYDLLAEIDIDKCIIDITTRNSKYEDWPDEFVGKQKYDYFMSIYNNTGMIPIFIVEYQDVLGFYYLHKIVPIEIKRKQNGSIRQYFKKEISKFTKILLYKN